MPVCVAQRLNIIKLQREIIIEESRVHIHWGKPMVHVLPNFLEIQMIDGRFTIIFSDRNLIPDVSATPVCDSLTSISMIKSFLLLFFL